MQRQGVFAVAVGGGPLQAGVELDDVVRDLAQFVVREGLHLVDPFAAFGPFGKVVEPRDVVPQPPRGEVAGDAHQQRDPQHEPEKVAVGGQHLAQRDAVGNGRTDDAAVAGHGRVEVVEVGALRMAADDVARAVGQGVDDFGTVEVVGRRERVERIVEEDASRAVDERDAQFAEGFVVGGDEAFGGDALLQGVDQAHVEELQFAVEVFGLEVLLAAVLEQHEAGHERPREDEQQQEEPSVVGEPTLQSRSHSPDALRCVCRRGRSCGAGG